MPCCDSHEKEMREEEKAKATTRLVPEMSHDEGLSALERGYVTEGELKTDRDRAFQRVQGYRKNEYR